LLVLHIVTLLASHTCCVDVCDHACVLQVWSEDMVTSDDRKNPDCTGKCTVSVFTMAKEPDRTGNKVKILTLSVRECLAVE
jgi:hypothetical protein